MTPIEFKLLIAVHPFGGPRAEPRAACRALGRGHIRIRPHRGQPHREPAQEDRSPTRRIRAICATCAAWVTDSMGLKCYAILTEPWRQFHKSLVACDISADRHLACAGDSLSAGRRQLSRSGRAIGSGDSPRRWWLGDLPARWNSTEVWSAAGAPDEAVSRRGRSCRSGCARKNSGQRKEAYDTYRRLVIEYGDQTEIVSLARAKLAAWSGPRNLKFEEGVPGKVPPGWFVPSLPKDADYLAELRRGDGCRSRARLRTGNGARVMCRGQWAI